MSASTLIGKYSTPKYRIGKRVDCLVRGDVIVAALSDGRIQWPLARKLASGRRSLAVYGDLARAIRRESNQAVCHWWGVPPQTVSKWRLALGVERKYAFLQPFNGVAGHRGKRFSLKLFTNLRGRSFLAGTISKVYVPHEDELKSAYDRMVTETWVEQMRSDVSALPRGRVAELATTKPELFINVRFRPEDAQVFDRMPEYLEGSKPRAADRYKLMHDEDDAWLPSLAESTEPSDLDELQVVRAAQQGTIVDLAHRRLQRRLYRTLCEQHGQEAVRMEFECVDLRVTLPEGATFYEIKMDTSAKKCIREAIGQLFEYSTYVNAAKAKTWVVVGDPAPTPDDITYLAHLRSTFNLPIYYAQFDWEANTLRHTV